MAILKNILTLDLPLLNEKLNEKSMALIDESWNVCKLNWPAMDKLI